MTNHPKYPDHHKTSWIAGQIKEVVFGMEDGMVSTLGAITGIAVGSGEHFVVILSGCVIIAVESISMGVGSYISNKSQKDIFKRKLHEEKEEIKTFPEEEEKELVQIYLKDGWPEKLAKQMSKTAAADHDLFLTEMAYHELNILPQDGSSPIKDGIVMFFSYIIGGAVPLTSYFFLSLNKALPASIIITLAGLFILGTATTKLSKRKWWKAGLEFLILASVATGVGYLVGQLAENFIK